MTKMHWTRLILPHILTPNHKVHSLLAALHEGSVEVSTIDAERTKG